MEVLWCGRGGRIAQRIRFHLLPVIGLTCIFLAPYLLMLFFNLLAVKAIDLCYSGLTLQTIGLKVKCWVASLIDMVICTLLGAIAIFNSDFNTLNGQFLSPLIIFLAPGVPSISRMPNCAATAITPNESMLARLGGPSGLIAMIGGMIASALWLNSTLLQGPLSRLFGNSDMSVFTNFIVAGGCCTPCWQGCSFPRLNRHGKKFSQLSRSDQ